MGSDFRLTNYPAQLFVRRASKPNRVAEGLVDDLWALRDGAFVVVPWKQALILEGRVFHVPVGTFSTPILGGGAGTILDIDQPELAISIPQSTAIMPLSIAITCHTPLIAADSNESEILVAIDRAVAAAISATNGTVETPVNMRTDLATGGSRCTIVSAITTDITVAPVHHLEWHKVITADVQGTAANALWGELNLDQDKDGMPLIVGPATLLVYWGGTVATNGFGTVEFAEFQSVDN